MFFQLKIRQLPFAFCSLKSSTSFKMLRFLCSLRHMLTDLTCEQFSLKADLLKELGMRSCQTLHKMPVCLSLKTSKRNLSSSDPVSCWYRHFCFWFFIFSQENEAWPPGGGQSSWPYPGGLAVCVQWFYSAPLSRTAGCDRGRCGIANTSIGKPKAH